MFQAKSNYHEEQIDAYNAYIKQCLANLQKVGDPKKKVRFADGSKKRQLFKGGRVIQTASKLHHKGVLLSIDGLPQTQFKNVQVSY